jgi:hypothetical protein
MLSKNQLTFRGIAMNRKYLGDALDHWKGSLFELLKESRLLHDFAVDPMAGDWIHWQPEDVAAFARLLRVNESQVISHKAGLADRGKYFSEIEHPGDLFLDPDVGIATGRVKNKSQYITPAEIESLVGRSDRLLAVYQHVSRKTTAKRVDEVCFCLMGAVNGLHWVSYESATVAMMFLSRSYSRLNEVASAFRRLLGGHAGTRIRMSMCADPSG